MASTQHMRNETLMNEVTVICKYQTDYSSLRRITVAEEVH